MERLHILDGYGYIFRAFYGLMGSSDRPGVRLTTRAGMPTGALYVYARMLLRLYLDVKPERIAVVFDAPGETFRDKLDEAYKATRRETPDDLKVQLPYFRPLTEAFCWPVLAIEGVEADDVIATLVQRARARGWDVIIYSGDKDLMQLVDEQVTVIDSMRQRTYDRAGVVEKFGVGPEQLGDWLALVGDTTDNIPGVPGIGKVTAAKLLREHRSIDGILAHAATLKGRIKERLMDPEQVEQLRKSRGLVRLRGDVTLDVDLDSLRPAPWDGTRLRQLFQELEFQALLAALDPSAAKAGADAGREVALAAQRGDRPPPHVATRPADLEALIAAAGQFGELALHVETDGQRPDRARVLGIAFAAPQGPAVYLPLAHRYLSVPPQIELGELPAALLQLLDSSQVRLVCHDAKAAVRALGTLGIRIGRVALDTMLGAYLLDAPVELDQLIRHFAKVEVASRKSLVGSGKGAVGFEAVAVEEAAAYSGGVAAALLVAAGAIEARLRDAGLYKLLVELELPLSAVLADMEAVGVTLDAAYLRRLSEKVAQRIAALEDRVFELAGQELNLGSPKQLRELLFDKLGLQSERMRKTKTGYSTDHGVLESMRDAHEIIDPILEHRELVKLKNTYIDALPPLVNPKTGRLHTTFNQAVAATGRLSSQDPNLQNIPVRSRIGREIRRAFIAAPGRALLSADYSQIELRIVAHLSGDSVLIDAFRDNIDIHGQTAAEVFGIPLAEVGAHERRVAKAVNYGLVYGQSEFGLARALDIPRQEARHYIARYFDRFSRVREFMDEVVDKARRDGAATTILGRRRPIPDLDAKNYQRRQAARRVAQNTPMQGSAADILKLAMLQVHRLIAAKRLAARMLLTVHDELLFEVESGSAESVAAELRRAMEAVYELRVPLTVEVGIGDNWADAK